MPPASTNALARTAAHQNHVENGVRLAEHIAAQLARAEELKQSGARIMREGNYRVAGAPN